MADFRKLIGLTIDEAREKIGEWWICSGSRPPIYQFERSVGAKLQLHTKNNYVTCEFHNRMAEVYTRNEKY